MKCFVRPQQQHSLCTLRLFRIIVLGFVVVLQFTSEWLRIRVHVASVPVQVLEKERNESALIDGLSQSVPASDRNCSTTQLHKSNPGEEEEWKERDPKWTFD